MFLVLRVSVDVGCVCVCCHKILDLKGTPRKDQSHLLDIFVSVVSVKEDLKDSSFLTTLEMDVSTPVPSVLANASAAGE